MFRHLLLHITSAICTFILLVTLCFFLVHFFPRLKMTDDIELLETRHTLFLQKQYQLDQAIHIRFVTYIRRLFSGDLGAVYVFSGSIKELLLKNIPEMLRFAAVCFLVTFIFGFIIGWTGALNHNSWLDNSLSMVSDIVRSIPVFILAPSICILSMNYLPSLNYYHAGYPALFIPVFVNSLNSFTGFARYVRSAMIEGLHQNYVRAARAKGMPTSYLFFNHLLRSSLIPLIGKLSIIFSDLLMGSVVIERVFSLPGIGRPMRIASEARDYNVVCAIVMFWGLVHFITSILVEIVTLWLNPKVFRTLH